MVTGSAAGGVVGSARGAGGGGGANAAGYDSLARGMLHGADAAFHLLGKGARHAMLIAVEQGLGLAQPESKRPAMRRREIKLMICDTQAENQS